MTVAEPGQAVLASIEERIVRWLDDQYAPATSLQIGEGIGLGDRAARSLNQYLLRLEGDGLVIRVGREDVVTHPAVLWVSAGRGEVDCGGGRAEVLAWLRDHGSATVAQIAHGAGYKRGTVQKALGILEGLGRVRRDGRVSRAEVGHTGRRPKLWRATQPREN